MKTLIGKTVLVTGAGSGIGRECARSFARRGARLVLTDVNAEMLAQTAEEVRAQGAQCFERTCDVARAESVAELAAAVAAAVGPLDVLVNNAGVAFLGAFEETPIPQWRRIFDINVIGTVHCIHAFLPSMRAAGGERKIVNVASVAGVAPAPNMSAYAASKHAVVGLSEVLAMELHDTPISVLVVCPGIINTPIVTAKGVTAPGISEAQVAKLQLYYVQHGCTPDVVAEGIVRSVLDGRQYLFVGPMAGLARVLARVSRRLTRKLTIRGAYESGYLYRGSSG